MRHSIKREQHTTDRMLTRDGKQVVVGIDPATGNVVTAGILDPGPTEIEFDMGEKLHRKLEQLMLQGHTAQHSARFTHHVLATINRLRLAPLVVAIGDALWPTPGTWHIVDGNWQKYTWGF